jgi:FkbM family methyltransferase
MRQNNPLKRIWRRIIRAVRGDPNSFLRGCRAILHIGANEGQERLEYTALNLEVLWVEALPDAFSRLTTNLVGLPNQRGVQALLTDKVGMTYQFNVASNLGASSSIYTFKEHTALWPTISFNEQIELQSTTLSRLLEDLNIEKHRYDAAIIDVQGAELLVLQGGIDVLKHLKYVRCEASDFESYAGACNTEQVIGFMTDHQFKLIRKDPFAQKEGVGTYYELTFRRN